MDSIGELFGSMSRMRSRMLIQQIVNFGLIVTTALTIWNGLKVVTGSESPIVVVLSGSMEPAFYRGDLLFLYMSDSPIEEGEIVVYKIEGRDIPIVHRILEVHERDGHVDYLTKGDNNKINDRQLYNPGQKWLESKHIIGRAKAFVVSDKVYRSKQQ